MRGHDDAATTRRRRRQPRCRCSPGSQSLQPPRSQSLQCPGRHRSFRRRYSPSLAAAPSLQVPAAALPHGPHCSPDPRGWVVEARTTTRRRRRDDQHWWSGRGGKDGGRRSSPRLTLRCRIWGWGPRRRTTGCSPRGALLSGLAGRRGGDVGLWADIAGQAGAVPTARRLQAAARGAGRLRRGAGAPHARVPTLPPQRRAHKSGAATTSPRPTRSSCATRGSATPSPRQLPGAHAAGPGASVRHLQPALL